MATVTAFDAKTRFGELLRRVARGEEVVITRHDKPVARIVPAALPNGPRARQAVAAVLDLQRAIGRRPKRAKLSAAEARAAIESGRR